MEKFKTLEDEAADITGIGAVTHATRVGISANISVTSITAFASEGKESVERLDPAMGLENMPLSARLIRFDSEHGVFLEFVNKD